MSRRVTVGYTPPALYLGTYGDPRGVFISCERGTPVGAVGALPQGGRRNPQRPLNGSRVASPIGGLLYKR